MHLDKRRTRVACVLLDLRVLLTHVVVRVFQVGEIDVNHPIEETENLHGIIRIRVVNDRQT